MIFLILRYKLLKSARRCASSKLMEYAATKGKPICAVGELPETYIILIHRENDRQRSLLNHTVLQTFMHNFFDVSDKNAF